MIHSLCSTISNVKTENGTITPNLATPHLHYQVVANISHHIKFFCQSFLVLLLLLTLAFK